MQPFQRRKSNVAFKKITAVLDALKGTWLVTAVLTRVKCDTCLRRDITVLSEICEIGHRLLDCVLL